VKEYSVISFYHFVSLSDPKDLVRKHKKFCEQLDIRGRVYLSEEGINGQISVASQEAQTYMDFLHSDASFREMECKIQMHHDHAFEKMTIKYRDQLAALDLKVNLTERGDYLEPKQWREKLENKDDQTLILDVRNQYEWKVGHFEGAVLPELENFRDFTKYAETLKRQADPEKTEILMYCTGGIRCELFSSLLKKEGFQKIFQLKGGVINYGMKEGKKHWKGKLFVFDDRLVVPICDEQAEILSSCYHCETPTDVYYNCANMDCNELFLSCKHCLEKWKGCCSKKCLETGRIRPYDSNQHPKPFRRLSFEKKKDL